MQPTEATEPPPPIDWPTLVDAKQPARKKDVSYATSVPSSQVKSCCCEFNEGGDRLMRLIDS